MSKPKRRKGLQAKAPWSRAQVAHPPVNYCSRGRHKKCDVKDARTRADLDVGHMPYHMYQKAEKRQRAAEHQRTFVAQHAERQLELTEESYIKHNSSGMIVKDEDVIEIGHKASHI